MLAALTCTSISSGMRSSVANVPKIREEGDWRGVARLTLARPVFWLVGFSVSLSQPRSPGDPESLMFSVPEMWNTQISPTCNRACVWTWFFRNLLLLSILGGFSLFDQRFYSKMINAQKNNCQKGLLFLQKDRSHQENLFSLYFSLPPTRWMSDSKV